jgi:hypothetical protein
VNVLDVVSKYVCCHGARDQKSKTEELRKSDKVRKVSVCFIPPPRMQMACYGVPRAGRVIIQKTHYWLDDHLSGNELKIRAALPSRTSSNPTMSFRQERVEIEARFKLFSSLA